MSLSASVALRRGAFSLDVGLAAADGEVVAVLGPNGAGKSTLLRALAGLQPMTGEVLVAGRDVTGLSPQRRRIGVVFQDHRLFPHLSALENVAFGLRCDGSRPAAARAAAAPWFPRLGLDGLESRRPGQLSGGQAQRVAVARALAVAPDLLLLDEPLSALDVEVRGEVRQVLRAALTAFGGPALLVTHDPLEALTLADRLVVLEAGRVVQAGTPAEVTRRPATAYVARLVGRNLWRGTLHDGVLAVDSGGEIRCSTGAFEGPALVSARPSSVALFLERPAGSSLRNLWPGTVTGVEVLGEHARVSIDGGPPVVAEITAAAVADLRLGAGDRVWAGLKASEVEAWPHS